MKNIATWATALIISSLSCFAQSPNLKVLTESPIPVKAEALKGHNLNSKAEIKQFLSERLGAVEGFGDYEKDAVIFIHPQFKVGLQAKETIKKLAVRYAECCSDSIAVACGDFLDKELANASDSARFRLSLDFLTDESYKGQLLHQEKLKGEMDWSAYLKGRPTVYVAYFGPEKEFPSHLKAGIEQLNTTLEDGMEGMVTLLQMASKGVSFTGAESDSPPAYLHLAQIRRSAFHAPANLSVSFGPGEERDTLVTKVHEMPFLQFRAGWSISSIDPKQFLLANDTLSISLDSTAKADFRQNLILGLELHLPRDIDRMQPLWKGWDMLPQRLGIFGGVRVVTDAKVAGFFLGGSLALTRDFAITVGSAWQRDFEEQAVAANGLATLKEAKENASAKLQAPTLYYGITISPSIMLKALGK